MFELLLLGAAGLAIAGLAIAYDGSRDVFHPLVLIGPMLAFLYGWMPWKLLQHNGLERFFDQDQLVRVQTLNVLGILALVLGCLAAGVRFRERRAADTPRALSSNTHSRLLFGAAALGTVGLICWIIAIVNRGRLYGCLQQFLLGRL